MKIINKSLPSEHSLIRNQFSNSGVILISPLIKCNFKDMRVISLRSSCDNNLREVIHSNKQAGLDVRYLLVDSHNFPAKSAQSMLINYLGYKCPVIDVTTGTNYSHFSTFDYLWAAYHIHPNEALASEISKYLVQKIPLQFKTAEECVSSFLDANIEGYDTLVVRVKAIIEAHESSMKKSVAVTTFDTIQMVETFSEFKNLSNSKNGTIVLIGATGSGKTKHGLQHLAINASGNQRVAYLSYLIPLVEQFCNNTGSTLYKGASLAQVEDSNSLALVVNSLHKHHLASFLLECDVLIIDEFEKVMSVVCCSTEELMPRRTIFGFMEKIISIVPQLIVADADVTDTTLSWIRGLRNDGINIIKATHNPYQNITATICEKYHLYDDMKNQLQNEKVILSDSIKAIRLILTELGYTDNSGRACEKVALKNNVLVLTGQNKGLPAQKALMLNPSEEVMKYDLILASPCLASGFSIETDYTDNVNVTSDLTLGVFELINFARRFRTSTKIRFFLLKKPFMTTRSNSRTQQALKSINWLLNLMIRNDYLIVIKH